MVLKRLKTLPVWMYTKYIILHTKGNQPDVWIARRVCEMDSKNHKELGSIDQMSMSLIDN